MGFFDRALLILYTICLAALSLVFCLVVITGTNPFAGFWGAYSPVQHRVILLLLGAVFFFISLRLLAVNLGGKSKRAQCIIHEGPVGQIMISSVALENLIMKISQQFRGIREITPKTFCTPEGLHVLVQATVSPDISIPQVTGELQTRIREYLQDAAGVTVKDIRVVVENVSAEVRARVE